MRFCAQAHPHEEQHRRTTWWVGGDGRLPVLKNFRVNSVFRASASCSKILNDKSILSAVKNFRANSAFQGKRKLLKNPEW